MSINVTGRHIAVTEALQKYVVSLSRVMGWYPANIVNIVSHSECCQE